MKEPMTISPQAHGRHRMPFVFGPSAGPRQGPQGQLFDMRNAPRTTTTARFQTDPQKLSKLLPPGCVLDGEAVVTVEHSVLHALEWLAGRSYSLIGVKFPVRFQGRKDSACGPFIAVLWENRTEPILTGREELGYPKLYCELPEARILHGSQHFAASWDGHTFIRMSVHDMEDAPTPAPTDAQGVLIHRYLPGLEAGDAPQIDEMALSPFGGVAVRHKRYQRCRAEVEFVTSTWEQLPTMFHVVNLLAELPILESRGGSVQETLGASDLGNTHRLS